MNNENFCFNFLRFWIGYKVYYIFDFKIIRSRLCKGNFIKIEMVDMIYGRKFLMIYN